MVEWQTQLTQNQSLKCVGVQLPLRLPIMNKEEIERMEYALQNPWVFKYHFGHIELIRKYYEITQEEFKKRLQNV
jgi:hypothetical protein